MFAAWRAWGGRGRLSPSRQGNLPFAAWQGNPVCAAGKGAAGFRRGGIFFCTGVGLSPELGISCQNGRYSGIFRVGSAWRKHGNRPRSVKKRVRELSVWSISPPWRAFLCGKNGISLLKEIYFLPQRRKFLAAKKFTGVWKAGKNGASDGFFFLFGEFPRTKSDCLFASLSPAWLTRGRIRPHGIPWRAAKCRGKRASGFHLALPQVREVRVFPPVPALAPARAILAEPFLTF